MYQMLDKFRDRPEIGNLKTLIDTRSDVILEGFDSEDIEFMINTITTD